MGRGGYALISFSLFERHLIPKKNVRRLPRAEREQKLSKVLCGLIWDKVERKRNIDLFNVLVYYMASIRFLENSPMALLFTDAIGELFYNLIRKNKKGRESHAGNQVRRLG